MTLLIVLIPFQLLRLRKSIEKRRTPENIKELKQLIRCDIIETIKENVAAGNITRQVEAQMMQRIMNRLREAGLPDEQIQLIMENV